MTPESDTLIQLIPTALVAPDPSQPRKTFPPERIEALADSIESEGLLQPITVRADPRAPGRYVIIAGECRWRAHCLKGIQTIKAIVSVGHSEANRRFRAQVMENMGREDMTLREEATALKKLHEMGDSDEQIAKAVGLSVTRARHVRLLSNLDDFTWRLIEQGSVNRSFVEAMMGRPYGIEQQQRLIAHAAQYGQPSASAAIARIECERNQDRLELMFEQNEIAQVRDTLTTELTVILMKVQSKIDQLSAADRTLLATSIGEQVSQRLPAGTDLRTAMMFLWRVGNHASVSSSEKKEA